jgi:predicted HTH domain antitoxin
MAEPQLVTLRLEPTLLDELDGLARAERIDRSDLVRRLLREGVERRRIDRAVAEYAVGRVSAWRAAELARVSLYEMLDRIAAAGVSYEFDPAVIEVLDPAVRQTTR